MLWRLLAIALAFQTHPAWSAEPETAQLSAVRVGFNGHYKLGCWTPVEVDIAPGDTAQTAQVQLIVADSDGVPTRVFSEPVALAPGQPATVHMFARFGQVEGDLVGRLMVDQQLLHQRVWQPGGVDEDGFPTAHPATDQLFVTVGQDLAISAALRIKLPRVHFARLSTVEGLPSRWFGYESVDQLLLLTSDPAPYHGFTEQHRAAAMLDWVRLGGNVLLTAGRSTPELFAPGSPLARLAPGEFVEMIDLRQLSEIESYAVASRQIAETAREALTPVAQFKNMAGPIDASVELGTEIIPLITRAAHGLGSVTLVSFDLDRPPFNSWNERGLLFARLLGLPTTRPAGEEQDDRYTLNTLGYNDLSGQLRAALFEFRDVSFVSFFVVGWLIFGYLLLIGPVDYFVVRRWLKRPELTWITFPLTVVAVSVAAYFAAYSLKGTALRLNQVELVDVDLATNTVRGTVWSSLFSPASEAYNLSLEAQLPAAPTDSHPAASDPAASERPQHLLAWLGLPGDALGGMNRQGASATLPIDRPYDFSLPLDAISNVPIQIWSTKSLIGRWQTTAAIPLEAELQEDLDGLLLGPIVNQLDVTLEEGRVFHDRWAYQLPKLAPGAAVRLGVNVQPVTTKTMLTQQRIIASKEVSTTFDAQSKEVPRILELMMFHELAGGDQYSRGLVNRHQNYVDLSRHAGLRRALFVARARHPGSKLTRDGQTLEPDEGHHWVYYRFVIPVTPRAAGRP